MTDQNKTDSSVTKTTRHSLHFLALLCAALFLCVALPHNAHANPRYAAVIMDAQSGKVLHQSSPHKSLPPASLTKMMTLFMAFEALENGKLHMNKYLVVSPNAIRQPPSKLGLTAKSQITVKEAIYILVTRSANDVAAAMGETISGSESAFAAAMTKRAHALGMKNTYFYNASGLPHPKQKSSAYDMAVLGRALMQYFPQHYHFFKTIRYNYKGRVIETHNNLMRRFEGMDGMKTGYVNASGFNLVSSAVRNNRRVIVAVFGGRTAVSRDNHVADLMNRGFAMLERGKTNVQYADATKPASKSASKAVSVTQAPTRDTHVASVQTRTTTTTKTTPTHATKTATSGTWTPDGGQVRTLTLPHNATASNAPAVAPATGTYQQASYQQHRTAEPRNWGIQVGAFSSAVLGQRALQTVQAQLPSLMEGGQAVVVPMTTQRGTVYRARIIGLSPSTANQACNQLTDCMAFVLR